MPGPTSRQRSPRRPAALGSVVVAVAVVALLLAMASPAGASVVRTPGSPLGPLERLSRLSAAAVPAGSVDLGAAPAGATLGVEVVLAPSDPSGVTALLSELYDPSSPLYQRWLQPGQFDADFAPSSATVAAAEEWLRDRGLSARRTSTFALTVTSTAARLAEALGTPFRRYRIGGGVQGYQAQGAPLVPSGLAGQVQAILGLSTLPTFQPSDVTASDVTASDVAAGAADSDAAGAGAGAGARGSALRPAAYASTPAAQSCGRDAVANANGAYGLDQLSAAYGITSLHQTGMVGAGVTIGVYELAPYSEADISAYEACYGLHTSVRAVGDTNPGDYTAAGQSQEDVLLGTAEADLDIEQAITQAPGASVVSYQEPNDSRGAYQAWHAAVDGSPRPQVISTSWGECELAASSDGSLGAYDTLFEQAAAQGQTVLAAAGDTGSEGCWGDPDVDPADQYDTVVDYPASSPYVTAVGGTTLSGSGEETAWNDCLGQGSGCADDPSNGAGGGGLSFAERAAAWQPILYRWSATCGARCREVPDISANAGTPMAVYGPQPDDCDPNGDNCSSDCPGATYAAAGCWSYGEGTSFSTPLVAGLVADRDQGCAATTGIFSRDLYGLYAESGHRYGQAFNPITVGDTDFTGTNGGAYRARPGYNLAAGVGSPIATGLTCPEVQSISASSGRGGTVVTVKGMGLEGATIYFGSTPAKVLSSSATSATVAVPVGQGKTTVHAASAVLGRGVQSVPFDEICPSSTSVHLPNAVGIAPVDVSGCPGYYVTDSYGKVTTFGSVSWHGDLTGKRYTGPIVAMAVAPGGGGYWLLGAKGNVYNFGDARNYGSLSSKHVSARAVDIGSLPNGRGYWILTSTGTVYAFGAATNHGSLSSRHVRATAVGMGVLPDGAGYWILTSSGTVYPFGAAHGYGSLSDKHVEATAASMTVTPDGKGYWVATVNGGVYGFGSTTNYGSANYGSEAAVSRVEQIAYAPLGGYYMVSSDGTVDAFGAGAVYFGGV